MNKYLVKIAEEVQEKPGYGLSAVTGGVGAALIRSSTPRLLGYENRYHGTTKDRAYAIKAQGLKPKHGGKGSSRTHEGGSMIDSSKGKIHTTKHKFIAKAFARFNQLDGKESFSKSQLMGTLSPKGEVIKVRLPMGVVNRMDMDPYMSQGNPFISYKTAQGLGATTKHKISAKSIKATKNPLTIIRYLKPSRLKKYYKGDNEARILSGSRNLGLGIGMLAIAKANLPKKEKNEPLPNQNS